MTFRHGKNTLFKHGSSGAPSTIVDYSAYYDSVTFPRTMDLAETTTFGAAYRTYLVGFPNANFSSTGTWDGAAAAIDDILSTLAGSGVAVNFDYEPGGSAAGGSKYTGGMILTSYQIGSPVGDKVSFSADWQVSGALTRTQL